MSMRWLGVGKQYGTVIARRDAVSLEKYMQEMGKTPLMSDDEEVEVFQALHEVAQVSKQKTRHGDIIWDTSSSEATKIVHKIVKANTRFVVSVAKRYQNQGLWLSDLINEGNLGLIKAVNRFDETRGFKFISYAVGWIRQSILDAINKNKLVKIPLNKETAIWEMNDAIAKLEQELKREPTSEELAKVLDMTMEELDTLYTINQRPVYLDAPIGDDANSRDWHDVITTNNEEEVFASINQKDTMIMIENLLNSLWDNPRAERAKTVITKYFGLFDNNPLSLEDIWEEMDLTSERVRQIKNHAIELLKGKYRDFINSKHWPVKPLAERKSTKCYTQHDKDSIMKDISKAVKDWYTIDHMYIMGLDLSNMNIKSHNIIFIILYDLYLHDTKLTKDQQNIVNSMRQAEYFNDALEKSGMSSNNFLLGINTLYRMICTKIKNKK